MRRAITILVTFCFCYMLSFNLLSCSPTSTGAIGPDDPTTTVSTVDKTQSKLEYQCNWLWASYTKLKTKVDAALPAMKELYVNAQEMITKIKALDFVGAVNSFIAAKANITEITKDFKE